MIVCPLFSLISRHCNTAHLTHHTAAAATPPSPQLVSLLLLRQQPTIVIKVGTSSLLKTTEGTLHLSQMCVLCETVARIHKSGCRRGPYCLHESFFSAQLEHLGGIT